MLASLEPSAEITGGVWFKSGKDGAEFNYELVNSLREAAMNCLTKKVFFLINITYIIENCFY